MQFAPLLRLWKRFRASETGVYAVEFALVAGPFLMLCFAIVETAVVQGANVLLDYAVSETARQVMTGEVQEQDLDAAGFRKLICDKVGIMLSCNKVKLDLRTFAAGKDIPKSVTKNLGVVDDSKFCYDPGSQGSITVLRAFYEWQWLGVAGFLKQLGVNINNAVLFSMAAFMNEPYGTKTSTHANCA